jgi:hypothetical protein
MRRRKDGKQAVCRKCGAKVRENELAYAESNGQFAAGVHEADCGCTEDNDDIGLHCECAFHYSAQSGQS